MIVAKINEADSYEYPTVLRTKRNGYNEFNSNQGHWLRANQCSSQLGLPMARFTVSLIYPTG
jgi:hypothetical protein